MEIKDINEEIRQKKVIIFDLDKTLSESKSPIDSDMAGILSSLLEKYKISVISGGKLEQLTKGVVNHLKISKDFFPNLYLQPTSGAALYVWSNDKWDEVYSKEIPEVEREKIKKALEESIIDSGVLIPEEVYGERIEDRGSQVTFSAFGQKAPIEVKRDWDVNKKKREKIQEVLKSKIPEYEASIGGSSSIDITKKGLNKGYGVMRLSEELSTPIKEMLFIGDRLEPGGNDYSVVQTGIDWIDVSEPKETKDILRKLLG